MEKKKKKTPLEQFAYVQIYLICAVGIGMLWAWPLKWAWNYTMTYLFGLPDLTWLHAWLLYSILTGLWKITPVLK